jgi:hypothetical protein
MYMDISPTSETAMPGYLPRTFSLYHDTTYALSPQDYGNYVFDHWENGSVERTRTFAPTAEEGVASKLVAYFRTLKPSPPPLASSSPLAPSADVNTKNDEDPVVIDILSPRTGQVMSSVSPTISGTAITTSSTDNAVGIDRVEISIDCRQYVRADGLVGWSFGVPPSLSDGSHSATVRAIDSEGNFNIKRVIFAVNADPFLNRTGVYVPLFVYPADKGLADYDALLFAKQKHPLIPIITTINPASGPGEFIDNNFINATKKLQSGGVTVLGYIYAGFGPRDKDMILADVDKYIKWYNVDGIFIDEFANWPGYEDKFREVDAYAKSQGLKVVIANAGWEVTESYVGTVDSIGISEADGYVSPEWLKDCIYCPIENGWHYTHDKSNFWFLRYAIDPLDKEYVKEVSKWVGLVYLTDGKSPIRWDHLPPYFDELLNALD